MLTSEFILSVEARAIVLHTLHWIASVVEALEAGLLILFFDLHQSRRRHLHHDAQAFRKNPPCNGPPRRS